ncbi:MAG: cyclic nucleotide-binding domain-containing protein [Chitinophagaceae bacterium]
MKETFTSGRTGLNQLTPPTLLRMEKLIGFLNGVHPLTGSLIDHLQSIVKYREIKKGEYLLRAGHICRDIHFIEQGLLRCFYQKGDLEVSSWFMKDGDVIVSVESFYQRKVSYEWIQALEDCKLFYISYEELYDIYDRFPEFNFISRELTQHYYILWTQLLHAIRMKSAEEKYEWLLERFPDYILRIPAKYLGSWLSISETHFSDVKRGRRR